MCVCVCVCVCMYIFAIALLFHILTGIVYYLSKHLSENTNEVQHFYVLEDKEDFV